MTTTSHQVRFFEASCHVCGHKFSMPLLSDFSYGEFTFHGEKHAVFGFLSAHEEPAWQDIESRLRQVGLLAISPTRSNIEHFHRVIAASADAISGQQLVPFPVCPSCGARSVAYGDSKQLNIREIPRVTFHKYQSLSNEMKFQRLGELWRQFA
jgi:hypothetical protein